MNKRNYFHTFNVTDKKNLSLREAFDVAQDIIDDVSTILVNEWPKNSEIILREITENTQGIKTYHFGVVAV